MTISNKNQVGEFFESHWEHYQRVIANNVLYHREMFAALDTFLSEHFKGRSFTLADLGCGDGSAILPVLRNKPIARYIGVDAASALIDKAPHVFTGIQCETQFICADMALAIKTLKKPIDVIFSSYALHHLSYADKIAFIDACHTQLADNGYFILVDGVLAENQTRDVWVQTLEKRLIDFVPNMSPEELAGHMTHPRNNDFPESLATFREIASKQKWKTFQVVIDKGMFAFMIFAK